MFGKYLTGYIGLIIVIIGFILLIFGLFNGFSIHFWIGLGLTFYGGYLRYQSKQAATVENIVKVDPSEKK